ncbi:MAG: hypothetical protein LWX83_15045 [Anaerolineae bacterium]|nr:hypothetical protein [Anaerolineae bacterium]
MNHSDGNEPLNMQRISWQCIEPVILKVRGRDIKIKNQEFQKLNEGQKAIFSFHVYYDHAKNDLDSFNYWSRLYINNGFFAMIKNGARYFSHNDFADLLSEIEVIMMDDGDKKKVPELFERFKTVGEIHLLMMAKIIVATPDYFFTHE